MSTGPNADALVSALFETTPLGLGVVDADLRFVRINERLAELNGLPVEAHLGRTLAEVLPALAPNLEPLYRGVLETGEAILDVEIVGETPARPGERRAWLASYVPVTHDGTPVGVLAVVDETTRLRRAEQEVGRLLEQMGDAFVAFDRELRYVYVNAKAGELFGRPPETLLGRTYLDEYPEAEGSEFHRAYVRALAQQQPAVFDEYYEPWDRWFENRVYPSPEGLAVFFTDITERKRAERALREANELLSALHRSVPVAIATMDVAGTVTSWNAGGVQTFGWTEDEVLGRSPVWVPEELRAHADALWARAAGGETIVGVETQRLDKHGRLVDVGLSLAPLYEDDETLTGIVVVAEDITERKRAEAKLQESEERLRLATAGARMGIWDVDLVRGTALNDARAADILGVGLASTVDEFRERLHPDDRDRVDAEVEAALAGSARYATEFRIVTEAGATRWLQASGTVVRDGAGTPVRMIGVLADVTERKEAEARLRESEERLRLAAATARLGVWEVDVARRAIVSDAATERMFGFAPGEFTGTVEEAHARVHPDDLPTLLAVERAAIDDGAPYDVSFRTVAPDGEQRWLQSSATVLRDDAGTAVRIVGVVLDITDRKVAEEGLRKLTVELESRVEQRTRELESARAEAERANAAKSEFLSRMSHELRTPLNAVLGFAQLLQRDGLDRERREAVDQILGAGNHLLELVEELLDVSRIETGALRLELEDLRVSEVVRRALELVQPLASERGVVLDPLPPEMEDVVAVADRQRLLQVALNLLSNAVKYNRPGGHAGVACAQLGEGRVEVAIYDTGVGISAADATRIFLPFERVGGVATVEGTGLGLSVAKALVEAMGGTLRVDSAPGKGSTFVFDLPLAAERPAAEASGPARTRTVLLIEDNMANVRLVERALARLPGTRLLSAVRGEDGIALARAERPDLVLLDLGLPDVAGDEVLRRLRNAETTADVPVVVVSADARRETIEQLLSAGALDYLPKPLDVDRLLELVGRL